MFFKTIEGRRPFILFLIAKRSKGVLK
ncbi:hypothetical protein MY3296_007354 [Beauveria thailandica]